MIKININMNELQMMMGLPENKQDLVDTWLHVISNGFKWNDFVLYVKELTQSYKVQIVGEGEQQIIRIRKFQYDNYGLTIKTMKYEISVLEYIEKLKDFVIAGSNSSLKQLYESHAEFVDIVPPMSFIQYIIMEDKKRTYEYVEPAKTRNTTSKSKKSQNTSSITEYTLLDSIKVYQKTPVDGKRTYQRHSTGWDVCGKFRHYKSGKVGWVKPYSTGDKRTKTNKEYKLRSDE